MIERKRPADVTIREAIERTRRIQEANRRSGQGLPPERQPDQEGTSQPGENRQGRT